jgi:uncharacterized protein (TIGR00369 family)
MALTDEEQATWRARMAEVMVGSRFIASLGITVEHWADDGVTLVLPFDEHLTNDGREYHGGAIAALVDTAGASAVWAGHDFDRGLRASTVSMTVNYIGRGTGDLVATAHCTRRGRDISFASIEVADRGGTAVATGSLVYRIVP